MYSYAGTAGMTVAQADSDARAAFIRRTYVHLAAAVAAFVALESALLKSALAPLMIQFIGSNQYAWLAILGAFMVAGWLARSLASSVASPAAQYVGLALYVVAEAIIFIPILVIARYYSAPSLLPNAAILTGALFLGLTLTAFTTRRDYSFLGSLLTVGGCVAIGLIVCGVVFQFDLGLGFSIVMVALAGAAILHDTSKIIHRYSTDQHVAASLELFASVALLFWYVLRILMRMSRR